MNLITADIARENVNKFHHHRKEITIDRAIEEASKKGHSSIDTNDIGEYFGRDDAQELIDKYKSRGFKADKYVIHKARGFFTISVYAITISWY